MAIGSQTDLSLTEIRFLHRDETCMKKRSGDMHPALHVPSAQQQQQLILTGRGSYHAESLTDAGILDAISRLSSSSSSELSGLDGVARPS
ncbi:hypothetical protein CORC01_04332 [Colletotrichum orchidophilum]|uniref:Uncharacterized protein n=1 Tax=Colletotrichum orchidophilum TaxID=1209926 RepID=A0A1G4BG46_9PEZI|nr:uncharacterized protein CORC01_04332 [Colletotrichum orchidophilum]OHF00351.1 hypothetical protein CORC01_04332 [Colletotrichum orchidophilum]